MSRDRLVLALPSDAERAAALKRRAERLGYRAFALGASDGPADAQTYRRSDDRIERPDASGGGTIPVVTVRQPEDLDRAIAVGRISGAVAVAWTAERVIPLENLIAAGRGKFEVWVLVDRRRDLPAMLGALEHGADRLIVAASSDADLDEIEAALDHIPPQPIAWELVALRRTEPAGPGDRVIVDTTSILRPAEGFLVGSSAAFLFHVVSEAVGSRYTRPRPFRVNAGAAHSYVLLADGTTRYLAELVAGDAVAAVEPNGSVRAVRVGRIKIERRPLLLVEAERGGRRFTVFVQDAETVRLSGETERRATVELTAGERVYGAAFPPGRHLGAVVDEFVEER